MKSFQVLERTQDIHRSYLLEASAGTGKTFSIENIVVRLLIEKEPLSLDQILVVTFTKSAAKDLLSRVHSNLSNVIYSLKNPNKETRYDYISKIIEEGEPSIKRAIQRLERALSCFDQAQIFTIHSFCARMLSEHSFECYHHLKMSDSTEPVNPVKLKKVIRDYFRSGKVSKHYSEAELNLLLKSFSGDLDALQNKLFDVISKGVEMEPRPNFEALLKEFNETMTSLKKNDGFTRENLFSDFMMLAPNYKEIYDIKKVLKADLLKKMEGFAALFDKEAWNREDLDSLIKDQLSILDLFDEANLKAKGTPKTGLPLHYPSLMEIIKQNLAKYVNEGEIFFRMAGECQQALTKYKQEEECFGYDDFLLSMRTALDLPEFFSKLRLKYKAAIIDEFQDTDPIQWEIFERLFLNNPGVILYLVGDPKQSIYAFRQADIYTYLQAAEKIGRDNHCSLDTNFRSHTPLVEALNAILTEEASPKLLTLPKRQFESLTLPKVRSSSKYPSIEFSDGKGAIHFFIAEARTFSLNEMESSYFFPFIAHEILELNRKQDFSLNQMAILVSDRYQASRLSEFLQKWHIPYFLQKSSHLTESAAFPAMQELLSALLHPKDESRVKIALGGKIIRWNHREMARLENHEILKEILKKFYILREKWLDDGFAAFFQMLLKIEWKEDSLSVIERLLQEREGEVFLEDLEQIRDMILNQEHLRQLSPEGLLNFLDEILSFPEAHEEIIKKIPDSAKNGVRIMTMHASKGLEFEIVFALGLIKRTNTVETLIPIEKQGRRYLKNIADKNDSDFQNFAAELDAEKIRQLYVAMTRAKYRLYNPILFAPSYKPPLPGTVSPMDLFLAKFGQISAEPSAIYERIHSYELSTFKTFADSLKKNGVSLTYSILNDTRISLSPYVEQIDANLKEPLQITIPGKNRFIQSFTSLAAPLHSDHSPPIQAPHNFAVLEKTAHTLPAGNLTGNLLHKCLESFDFHECRRMNEPNHLEKQIFPFIQGTPFEEWGKVIYEMAFNALKTPFIDGFSLSDVSLEHCCKEAEFLYESFFESSPGYLKGFMDLFFFHQGKYYLLDWKSNWLGPDKNSYQRENLQIAMQENDYFLQAKLYKEALKKYLTLFDSRPFEEIFGGVYYVFLRGLPNGVYHFL